MLSIIDLKVGAKCCISVDIDAVAGWLGSYQGEDSTSDISRGLFAGSIGVRRLLKLFEKYNIKTTCMSHTMIEAPLLSLSMSLVKPDADKTCSLTGFIPVSHKRKPLPSIDPSSH